MCREFPFRSADLRLTPPGFLWRPLWLTPGLHPAGPETARLAITLRDTPGLVPGWLFHPSRTWAPTGTLETLNFVASPTSTPVSQNISK